MQGIGQMCNFSADIKLPYTLLVFHSMMVEALGE